MSTIDKDEKGEPRKPMTELQAHREGRANDGFMSSVRTQAFSTIMQKALWEAQNGKFDKTVGMPGNLPGLTELIAEADELASFLLDGLVAAEKPIDPSKLN